MTETLKEKVLRWSWILFIVVGSFIIFVNVIQPILVNIHPMFATEPQITGRRPNTPDGLAYLITLIICYAISMPFYIVVSTYVESDD